MSRFFQRMRLSLVSLVVGICGCAELARWEFPQPDRVRYTVSRWEWRKRYSDRLLSKDGDHSAERWSKISKTISGKGFLSLQQEAGKCRVFSGDLGADWELEEDWYLNLRFSHARKKKLHHIRSLVTHSYFCRYSSPW